MVIKVMRFLPTVLYLFMGDSCVELSFGAAGQTIIVQEGERVPEEYARARNWPHEMLELLNDPLRQHGWNSWFTGLPSDVDRFLFRLGKSEDLDHIIRRFSEISSESLRIQLSAGSGPIVGFGGIRAPGVSFSIGNQKMIDAWYARLPVNDSGVRTHGVHEYEEPPTASPPTLTIYLDNEHIALQHLEVPLNIDISLARGHRWRWDRDQGVWNPPPGSVMRFIDRHRSKQRNAEPP